MFDSHGAERLTQWKNFRDQLEKSSDPFQEVVDFWCKAPLVGQYLDPYDRGTWPDPWHLVLDDKFDNLSIALGMLYTVKLTQRFMDVQYKIHMSIAPENKEHHYFISIDDQNYLNMCYRQATVMNQKTEDYKIIWQDKDLP